MLFQDIAFIGPDMEVREHQYVGTLGQRIAYIGGALPADPAAFGPVYQGQGKLLLPAFYNAHTHLPMTLLRGYGENLSLMRWLNERIFPFENQLRPEDIYYSCLLGIAEMLRYGVASATDMYMGGDALARAFADSGAKANFSLAAAGPGSYYDRPAYQEALAAEAQYHGLDGGRLRMDLSLHAEYTSGEAMVRELALEAAKRGLRMHVHVSETADEVAQCRERHGGQSPVAYLAARGLFDVPALAAHCVHVDEDDIAILAEKGVSVATCPKSNLKLASGVCPVSSLLRAGVNVAIGTDSVASNNNLNMLEEMRFFNLLQKGVNSDPTRITPAETLYAATRAGALAQGREDCGLIREGFRADLTVLDMDKPYLLPCHSLLNDLIYAASGSEVILTMVDGQVLYQDGGYPHLDMEKLCREVKSSTRRILAELV